MTKEIITVKDLKVAYGDFVLFDDINFDVGVMRIRRNGSDGGHNGIKSIIFPSTKKTSLSSWAPAAAAKAACCGF